MTNIEKTKQYLLRAFEQSEYYKDKPEEKAYRLNHTFRVANIGKLIASTEDINEEALIIGCLLHDLSYVKDFTTKEEHINHGRESARMAREFVYSLDMKDHLKEELLYGVAIHVDDKSDFEGNRTVLAETISECDNIDRFDKYRLYEALLYSDLTKKTLTEQITFCDEKITRLNSIKNYVFKTKTSNDLWQSNLDYQIEYFTLLKKQLEKSIL